jgi:hypothetical protein
MAVALSWAFHVAQSWQDLGITEVFTGDAHLRHVNLGFQRVP